MREEIEFDTEGVTLRGWFYPPENGSATAPCVVMAPGAGFGLRPGRTAPRLDQQDDCAVRAACR
jgi:hypothetical protein